MTDQKKGMLWIIVATFFFSLMGSFVKLGASRFSSVELVFYRSFISLLFLFIYIVISQKEIKTPHLRKQIDRGVVGFLTKRSAAEELIKAIKSIHQGKRYLEPSIAQQMAITQLSGETNPVEILSDREFEVFIALAKGKSTNDIADTLCLSPRTVGTHLYNIKQKLNANNSAEIALIAIRCGLINP